MPVRKIEPIRPPERSSKTRKTLEIANNVSKALLGTRGVAVKGNRRAELRRDCPIAPK